MTLWSVRGRGVKGDNSVTIEFHHPEALGNSRGRRTQLQLKHLTGMDTPNYRFQMSARFSNLTKSHDKNILFANQCKVMADMTNQEFVEKIDQFLKKKLEDEEVFGSRPKLTFENFRVRLHLPPFTSVVCKHGEFWEFLGLRPYRVRPTNAETELVWGFDNPNPWPREFVSDFGIKDVRMSPDGKVSENAKSYGDEEKGESMEEWRENLIRLGRDRFFVKIYRALGLRTTRAQVDAVILKPKTAQEVARHLNSAVSSLSAQLGLNTDLIKAEASTDSQGNSAGVKLFLTEMKPFDAKVILELSLITSETLKAEKRTIGIDLRAVKAEDGRSALEPFVDGKRFVTKFGVPRAAVANANIFKDMTPFVLGCNRHEGLEGRIVTSERSFLGYVNKDMDIDTLPFYIAYGYNRIILSLFDQNLRPLLFQESTNVTATFDVTTDIFS